MINKILIGIIAVLAILAVLYTATLYDDFSDPFIDDNGKQIGDFKQLARLSFSTGGTTDVVGSSNSILGIIVYDNKHISDIRYVLDVKITNGTGSLTLDLTNYKVTFNIINHATQKVVQTSTVFDYSGTGYPFYKTLAITGDYVEYISSPPSWNTIGLIGTYDFQFVTSGSMKYSMDNRVTWHDIDKIPSSILFTVQLE